MGSVLGDFEFSIFPCVWALCWRTLSFSIFPCVWVLYLGTLSFQYSPLCGLCSGRLRVFNILLCVGSVLKDFDIKKVLVLVKKSYENFLVCGPCACSPVLEDFELF